MFSLASKTAAILALFGGAAAQQPGQQKNNQHPSLSVSLDCTVANGCSQVGRSVVLDSNWYWLHQKGDWQPNCFEGNAFNSAVCPDPATCAENCALDAGDVADYESTYGITTSGNQINMQYVTGSNVGSRVFLMDETEENYEIFKLKNREFTFDADMADIECGMNGALYFVEMDKDGGKARFPGNNAGAAYGTGYCDAQCHHDVKFINGEANVDWSSGACCQELDIWEANKQATAVTPHTCEVDEQTRCDDPITCGDDNYRFNGVCDKDGCDRQEYRLGDHTFYGPGSGFDVDSSRKVTVVTQFITSDGTDAGDLVEIRRFYVQDGNRFDLPSWTGPNGAQYDSITDEFCAQSKAWYGDTQDEHNRMGGLKSMGEAMDRGMVLTISLWDDTSELMLWLDGMHDGDDASANGVKRGICTEATNNPNHVRSTYPSATVKYSNIRVGEIGSTTGATPAPPSPPTPVDNPTQRPTPAPPAPAPSDCPADRLYQQCGGDGYSGETCCPSNAKCYTNNQWYSQCLTACPSGWDCTVTLGTESATAPTRNSKSGRLGDRLPGRVSKSLRGSPNWGFTGASKSGTKSGN